MKKMLFLLCLAWGVMTTGSGLCDTVYTNNGSEIKGIIVEDYRDRVVISTVDGEKTLMKSDIKELYYDTEEMNLIKLAEQSREKGDYVKAFVYYDKAYKMNPDSRQAKDGLVFLQGYLFKKEMSLKEEAVKRHNDFEKRAESSRILSDEEEFSEELKKLDSAIGITLKTKDGLTRIESVRPRSPAYEAGIKKGDILVAVWGRLVGYLSLPEVVETLLEKTSLETKCTIDRTVDVKVNPAAGPLAGPKDLIGADLTIQFDGLVMSEVKNGGPAGREGLKQGDLVVGINGSPTRYMPLKSAVEAIKKSKGDIVKFTIRREVVIWGKGER